MEASRPALGAGTADGLTSALPGRARNFLGLSASDAKEAIFGAFDGMTSTLGVVAGLLATRSSPQHIVAGAIGIAVAATIGMGAGQYLSDDARNVRKAIVMAVGLSILVA